MPPWLISSSEPRPSGEAVDSVDYGIVNPATLVGMGDLSKPEPVLAILGFFIIVALEALKVRGSVLIGILLITVLSIVLGITPFAIARAMNGEWVAGEVRSADKLADVTARYLYEAGGKRVRPMLSLLTAQLGGGAHVEPLGRVGDQQHRLTDRTPILGRNHP